MGGLRVDTGNGQGEVLLLSHAAVSTSGSAHQMVKIGGKSYSHVLDPRSGLGVTEGEAGKRPGAFRRAGGCPGDGRVCDV